jgi:large subunit ribosomal protein L4
MKIPVYNISGTKTKDITLPKEIFEVKVNSDLITQALRIYTSNSHQRSSQVLSRGEVKRTKTKVWRQKGTGRARHGSRNAPIFVGGGVAHGPKAEPKAKLKLSKKMKVLALTSALSTKTKDILAIENLDSIKPKTKSAQLLLTKIVEYKHTPKDRILLVLPQPQPNTLRSFKNLPGVEITQASRINIYEIIKSKKIIFDLDSLEVLKKNLS